MVESILNVQGMLIENMRRILQKAQNAHDEGTIDLISSMLKATEKNGWKLYTWLSTPVSTNEILN